MRIVIEFFKKFNHFNADNCFIDFTKNKENFSLKLVDDSKESNDIFDNLNIQDFSDITDIEDLLLEIFFINNSNQNISFIKRNLEIFGKFSKDSNFNNIKNHINKTNVGSNNFSYICFEFDSNIENILNKVYKDIMVIDKTLNTLSFVNLARKYIANEIKAKKNNRFYIETIVKEKYLNRKKEKIMFYYIKQYCDTELSINNYFNSLSEPDNIKEKNKIIKTINSNLKYLDFKNYIQMGRTNIPSYSQNTFDSDIIFNKLLFFQSPLEFLKNREDKEKSRYNKLFGINHSNKQSKIISKDRYGISIQDPFPSINHQLVSFSPLALSAFDINFSHNKVKKIKSTLGENIYKKDYFSNGNTQDKIDINTILSKENKNPINTNELTENSNLNRTDYQTEGYISNDSELREGSITSGSEIVLYEDSKD